MKIIYGITKANFGGAQRYVLDLACEAKRRGHDVAVLTQSEGVLVDKLEAEGVRVIKDPYIQRDISPLLELKSLHFIFRTLLEEKPDVFHTNSSKMGGLGGFAGRLARVQKIVFTSHGWAWNETRPWWQKVILKIFYWKILILSHLAICVSENTKEAVERWPFVKHKLRVVRNGISTFELLDRESARSKLGIESDKTFVVGTLAELHHIKGLDILLLAWSEFRYEEDKKLVILGEGEERHRLENMASNLGISDTVDFRGYVEGAKCYLRAFDTFVLPSRSENLPYAVLEAGMAGRPTIATGVGGVPEVIEPGINGALVPPRDAHSLLSSLILFYENPRMRDRLGADLKKTVEEKFSKEKMFEETFELYK